MSVRVTLILGAIVLVFMASFSVPTGAQSAVPCFSARSCAIDSAFRVSARRVDAALPDMPLIEWLRQTAGQDAKVTTGTWTDSWGTCDGVPDETSPPNDPSVPWRVCAQATVALPDDRVAAIALSVQMEGLTPSVVQFGSAYLVDPRARHGSLDVHSLRELPRALATPAERWPHAELRIRRDDVRIEPPSPKPGVPVTLVVRVRNVGADLARVSVLVAARAECSDIAGVLASVDVRISARDSHVWRVQFMAPAWPRWWLHVRADLKGVAHYIPKYELTASPKGIDMPIGSGPFKKCLS